MKFAIGIHVNSQKGINDMENYFSNARNGDKVFHIIHEWGTITGTADDSFIARFINKENTLIDLSFWSDGRQFRSDKNPSVFWNEVKIVPPPKPKRKAEKTIAGWINIYPNSTCDNDLVATSYSLYKSLEIANQNAQKDKRLGEAYHVTHKYTIEE